MVRRMNAHFVFKSYVKEDHGQPLFGTQFNNFLSPDSPMVFASVGANRVTIYECADSGQIDVLQCYGDPDVSRC